MEQDVGNSSSSLRRKDDGPGYGGGYPPLDSSFGSDQHSGSGHSHSPDPSKMAHRRYSSVDSADGSGGHSRQGSDSTDSSYATRRMSSTQGQLRRQSTSTDPMHFVRGGNRSKASELATTAQFQMKVAAESKTMVSQTKAAAPVEDTIDWQSNLTTWKSRRKSQSEKTYMMRDQLEQVEKKTDEKPEEEKKPPTSVFVSKTFSQMAEERERRKSTPLYHYPIEDEEEDDNLFSDLPQLDKPTSPDTFVAPNTRKGISPWAQDSSDKVNNMPEESVPPLSVRDDQNNNNSNKDMGTSSRNKFARQPSSSRDRMNEDPSPRYSGKDNKATDIVQPSTSNIGRRTQNKIGSILANFEQSENKSAAPKSGYNEKVDIGSRRKAFENISNTGNSNSLDHDSKPISDSGRSRGKLWANDVDVEEPIAAAATTANFSAPPPRWNTSQPVTDEKPVEASQPENGHENEDDMESLVKKTIFIKQKPNNDKGFGFIISGGVDMDKPLVISKVVLGSAADVCNLKVNDEVMAVNGKDASGMDTRDVGDIVGKAVGIGSIEIKVLRRRSEDDSEEEDDDMTSSSDEGEEELNVMTPVTPNPPELNLEQQLKAERDWLAQQTEPSPSERAPFSEKDVTVSSSLPQDEIDHGRTNGDTHEDDDEKDGGPPAILRKWQRQRNKKEYTFELDNKAAFDVPAYGKTSLNTQSSSAKEPSSSEPGNGYPPPINAWGRRQNQWLKQQDTDRQPESFAQPGAPPQEQAQFEERKATMQKEYDDAVQMADKNWEDKMRREQEFLQPQLDKAQILEERRQQRRNRIQESAAAAANSAVPPQQVPEQQQMDQVPASSGDAQGNHVTSMTFNIVGKGQPPKPISAAPPFVLNSEPQKAQGQFVVKPFVQGEPRPAIELQVKLPTHAGQIVDINTAQVLETERQRIRQEEKWKVEQERQQVEQERKAKGEEMERIREKERKLQEQEEMLRAEKEKFKKEQEEFKRLQQQQLQQQQQQQQQQVQPSYMPQQECLPPQPSTFTPISNNSIITPSYSQTLHSAPPPATQNSSWRSSPTTQSTDRNFDPANRAKSVDRKEFTVTNNSAPYKPDNQIPQQTSSNPPWMSQDRQQRYSPAPQENNKPARDDFDGPRAGRFTSEDMLSKNQQPSAFEQQTSRSREGSPIVQQQQYRPVNAAPLSQNAPSKDPSHPSNLAPRARLRGDNDWQNPNTSKAAPMKQKPEQKWLPAEPKANMPRKSLLAGGGQDHWLIQEAERRRKAEARGRLHAQEQPNRGSSPPSQFSGPIKPYTSNTDNHWRNKNNSAIRQEPPVSSQPSATPSSSSMPDAIRQTLLDRTTGGRGSNSPELFQPQYAQSYAPQQQQHPPAMQQIQPQPQRYSPHNAHQPNPGYQSYNPAQFQPQQQQRAPSTAYPHVPKYDPITSQVAPPRPTPRAPVRGPKPFGSRDSMAANGSQLCSHCNMELGFGAAMVIESLGLFFHVQCFRCCVCHASLGTGAQGADVRVRLNKLHCPNCYSNDEAAH